MNRTFSVLVNDRPGVLARVASLFSRRGFNIQSITVGASEQPTYSRMTIVSTCDDVLAKQIAAQLGKLVDVISVDDISLEKMVKRELALLKVRTSPATRPEISHILEPFRTTVVDMGHTSLTVEVTGDQEKVDALIGLLLPYGVLEIARTGITALQRSGTELPAEFAGE